jgi:hypothetical protein
MKKTIFTIIFISNHLIANNFLFNIENDFINGTDRHLTNTMSFSWMLDENDTFYDSLGLEFHHDTYTPENLNSTDIKDYDMPFAANAYGIVNFYFTHSNYYQSIGLTLGHIGPKAYAHKIQKFLHEVRGVEEPKGWKNQIGDRTTYGINYAFIDRFYNKNLDDGNKFDINNDILIEYASDRRIVTLGTLFRYGSGYGSNFQSSHNIASSQVAFYSMKGWSFSLGLFYQYMDYFYILDNFKYEYNIKRKKSNLGNIINLEYYYKHSKVTILVREMDIVLNQDLIKEQWLGISYLYKF